MGKATRWLKGLLGMKKEKEKDSFDSTSLVSSDKKERKRWSFAKSGSSGGRDGTIIPQNQARDAAWTRSYISETEKEQNKHAIAVAAATAAAADAAVAAAHAAVAVVRLTSQGRGSLFGGGRERWAALKIQTIFRSFLARKAFRALKGLVKLQALVRGYLVRKQATATLRSMQALIRAQTAVRTQHARRSFNKENRFYPENKARRSVERFEDRRSDFHSKRLSTSLDINTFGKCESPKIVEIDTYKPRSGSHRISSAFSEYGEELPYSSPLPCQIPSRIAIPDCGKYQDFDWYFNGDECRFSTAQSTPRFPHSIRSNAPATPAKSVCGYNYIRPYINYPNYMAKTQSFNAKLRCHSAPKQRPEPGPKKKQSLNEIMASRNSTSGIRMQRSFAQVEETFEF